MTSTNTVVTAEQRENAEAEITRLRKNIKYDTKDYAVEFLVMKFKEQEIFVPEYQRKYVWDLKRKVDFIESVLLGFPIPFMFFGTTPDGRVEIIDGAQRTHTLVEFLSNELVLHGMTSLKTLEGFSFRDLPIAQQRKFKNESLRIVFLDQETSDEVRSDLFRRINTTSMPALPAEVRRGSYAGPFVSFIEECARDPRFEQLAPMSEKKRNRYEGSELVTRLFAYSDGYKEAGQHVEQFLSDFVERHREDFNRNQYWDEFNCLLEFTSKHFENGFASSPQLTPRVRFEALAVGIVLALRERPELMHKSRIDTSWINSAEFLKETTSDGSNNSGRLRSRIEYVRDKLLSQR